MIETNPDVAKRVIGTETEFGIYAPGDPYANAIAMSTEAVQTYAAYYRPDAAPVGWDYRGEDPLNDLRGHRLDRAFADPSQLTDDPYHLAPPAGWEELAKSTEDELKRYAPTTIVLPNGGRFYVDHAHPEYSSPEVTNALDAVIWDRAGEVLARRVMSKRAAAGEREYVLVKNNVDGKGAAYGTHENYQVDRLTDLDVIVRFMIPFLASRPVICGAGRVGIGQKSEVGGFQISQRADYVENDIGLETTFNRPIFNMRDEPHAQHYRWRRIHVINGDANQFDVSILLKIGTTALVLRALEEGVEVEKWAVLDLVDSVGAVHQMSLSLDLKPVVSTKNGQQLSALDLQEHYLELVEAHFERTQTPLTEVEILVLQTWRSVIDRMRQDVFSVAAEVEWVGKYQLLSRQKQRLGATWLDPRLAAIDLQWGDLRAEKNLVRALEQKGMVRRLTTDQQLEAAVDQAPADTRAKIRGKAVATRADLVKASWSSLVFEDREGQRYVRVPLPEPTQDNPEGLARFVVETA